MSAFAEFTLHLTYALRTEFTRVRSFVFVDTVDEVTDILAGAALGSALGAAPGGPATAAPELGEAR